MLGRTTISTESFIEVAHNCLQKISKDLMLHMIQRLNICMHVRVGALGSGTLGKRQTSESGKSYRLVALID